MHATAGNGARQDNKPLASAAAAAAAITTPPAMASPEPPAGLAAAGPEMGLVARGAARAPGTPPRRFYSSAQWTADGTALLVAASDCSVSSFVLPADLLEPAGGALELRPEATARLPEPTYAVAGAPFFSLADAATQTYLVGCRDHPVHLRHAFPHRGDGDDDDDDGAAAAAEPPPLAAYRLVRAETEQFLTPASLLWPAPGTHFVCGSASRIDYFDVSRHGTGGPVVTVPTIPSRRHRAKGGGVGMKGTVAALAAAPPDAALVAAGTRTRWLGLYDVARTDGAVANWSVAQPGAGTGHGIVQVAWSPCGRYLVVNERRAGSLLVYDVRGAGRLLANLAGRAAATQQRLACDVYPAAAGFEVWAGADDGSVAVWEDVGLRAGAAPPSWRWQAHDAPVGSTAVHASGSVAATCSGAWEHLADDELGGGGGGRVLAESSLSVWCIGAVEG